MIYWHCGGTVAVGNRSLLAAPLPKIKPKQRGKVVKGVLLKRRLKQTGSEMNAAKISLF